MLKDDFTLVETYQVSMQPVMEACGTAASSTTFIPLLTMGTNFASASNTIRQAHIQS